MLRFKLFLNLARWDHKKVFGMDYMSQSPSWFNSLIDDDVILLELPLKAL